MTYYLCKNCIYFIIQNPKVMGPTERSHYMNFVLTSLDLIKLKASSLKHQMSACFCLKNVGPDPQPCFDICLRRSICCLHKTVTYNSCHSFLFINHHARRAKKSQSPYLISTSQLASVNVRSRREAKKIEGRIES